MLGRQRSQGVSFWDIFTDAARTSRSRPGRTIGLGLAVALGVGTFVGVLSMSDAAEARVEERISALRPEHVRASPIGSAGDASPRLGDDALDRLAGLPGFRSAVIVRSYEFTENDVRARLGNEAEQVQDAPIMSIDGDLADATRSVVDGETIPDEETRKDRDIALVGAGLARRLGLSEPTTWPTIWVNGVPFTTVGVIESSEYLAATTDAVVFPHGTAQRVFGETGWAGTAYIRVGRGMADAAADTLPLRLSPESPESWAIEVPHVPLDVAEGISDDLRNLSLGMAALVMVIGIVAIGNAMMRAVFERISEIGVRRSLGARASHVLGLLVVESMQVGMVAGIIGAGAGVALAVSVALSNGWPVVVSVWATAAAVPAAMLAGGLGGLLPAVAAVRVTPSQALRRE